VTFSCKERRPFGRLQTVDPKFLLIQSLFRLEEGSDHDELVGAVGI